MPKIRIKQSPTGNIPVPDNMSNGVGIPEFNRTLQPVDRSRANIEAERGETAVADFDNDGTLEHMNIGGKRHVEGGTPLDVPDNTFIFSDTKDMRMSGPLVKFFGKNADRKKGYTPAEIAKQYDLSKFKADGDDPNSDPITKRTADLMQSNFEGKLGQLAFLQEAKKGFPTGIPEIAMQFAQSVMPQGMGDHQAPTPGYSPDQAPAFAFGGDYTVDPYKGSKSKTPTGMSNAYNLNPDALAQWEQAIPGISKLSNTDAQGKMYDYMLQYEPQKVKSMWSQYGLTKQGMGNADLKKMTTDGKFNNNVLDDTGNLKNLRGAYTDGMFGARQFDPSHDWGNQDLDHATGEGNAITNKPLSTPPQLANSASPTGFATPPDFHSTSDTTPTGELAPDRWSQEEALSKRLRLKKYLPYIDTPDIETAHPAFYDPGRELAANQESTNAQLQFNAESGNYAQQRANASMIAGQGASAAANTIAKYDNMNVGAANQFAAEDAQVMNNYAATKAKNNTDLYNGTVIANQQYDNAVTAADDDILRARTNAWNNRSQMELMNKTNKNYHIDPETGSMQFTPTGKNVFTGNGSSGASPGLSMESYPSLYAHYLSLIGDPETARKEALLAIRGDRETQTFNGSNPIAASTRVTRYSGEQ
jgi:hypothetical protein